MPYYKLIYDYENDDNYVNCDTADIGGYSEYITTEGQVIEQWNPVLFEYSSSEGAVLTDYLANVHRWLAVSSAFKQLTKELINDEVQYLPINLLDRDTKSDVGTYYVANIIEVVDALDLENSKYDVFELDDEKIFMVEKYALKGKEIIGKHIFRLKGDTVPIFVSDTIKKIIEENELVGFRFLEVAVTME